MKRTFSPRQKLPCIQITIFIFFILLLLLTACTPKTDQGEAWKAKVITAHGGLENIKQISTVIYDGKISTRDDKGTVTLILSHPGILRTTMKYQHRYEDRILLGNRGWRDFGGGFAEASEHSLEAMIFQYDHLDLPMGLLGKKFKIIYAPQQTGELEIPVLKLTTQGHPPMNVIIDPKTGLIRQVNGEITMGGHEVIMGVGYSDYRKVNGVMLPFRIVNYVNGRSIAESRYDTVQINVPLTPEIFTLPHRKTGS